MVGAIIGGLAGAGVFSSASPSIDTDRVMADIATVAPDTPLSMETFDGLVTVRLPAGTVNMPMVLRYQPLTVS